jgi:electron transport complex protein RnfD
MSIYFFGLRSLVIIALTVGASVGFEYLFERLLKRPITIRDCSAAVTGLLLAYNLPPTSPLWMPIVGAFVAIIIAKQLFGGLGQNFINPALAGRAFLMAAYTPQMASSWISPSPFGLDAVSSATPLGLLKEDPSYIFKLSDLLNALWGNTSGVLGETCAIALILGGAYLLFRKIITWHIPVAFIVTVYLLSTVLGRQGFFAGVGIYEIMLGGVMLGAFFMATDYATSPMNDLGKIIMGIGCGILTVVIRNYGGYPEGVSYAILIMNLFVPLLDKYCNPRVFGTSKKKNGSIAKSARE